MRLFVHGCASSGSREQLGLGTAMSIAYILKQQICCLATFSFEMQRFSTAAARPLLRAST